MFEAVFDNPRPTIEVVEYDNELSLPMTEAVRKIGGMKGLFIPGITAEEFKNGSLEAVEDLISSGEVYDVTLRNTSAQPEQRWIPVSERLPEEEDSIFARYYGTDSWRKSMFHKKSREVIVTSVFKDGELHTEVAHTTDGEWHVGVNAVPRTVIAWVPLPEPYKEEKKK